MRRIMLMVLFPLVAVPAAFSAEETAEQSSSLVLVAGGCFQRGDVFQDGQGDERPAHKVCLDDFYIGRYEITQWQWEEVMDYNPSLFKRGDNYPVERVTWDEVQVFLDRLQQRTGKAYRLPTEAEWEYAARSGGKDERWSGTNELTAISEFAWYADNAGEMTHPVGEKRPNSLGLHDMSGNVWEWVADRYDKYYYQGRVKDNPQGPSEGAYRMFRGGSWRDKESRLRTMERCRGNPRFRASHVGFRLALTP